jgi:hypothetical protein
MLHQVGDMRPTLTAGQRPRTTLVDRQRLARGRLVYVLRLGQTLGRISMLLEVCL